MPQRLYQEYGIFAVLGTVSSYSKAAEKLGMHVSSISRSIQRLEEHLGYRLILSSSPTIRLTKAGLQLANQLGPLYSTIDHSVEVLQKNRLGKEHIRILGPQEALTELINPVIHLFSSKHPGLTFGMEATTHLPDPLEDDFDIFISHRRQEITHQTLVVSRLCSYPIALYASPSLIQQFGMPEHPDDLVHWPCLARPNEERWTLLHKDQKQQHDIPLDIHVTATPQTVRMALARSGDGITPASVRLCAPHVKKGELVPVLPDYRLPEGEFYVVQQSHYLVASVVKEFIAALHAYVDTL